MSGQPTTKRRWLPDRTTRIHMIVVGAAIWILGGVTRMIFPDISQWWAVAAILIVAHVGLAMALWSAVIEWIARRREAAAT